MDSAGLAAEHVKSAPALSEWRGQFAKALAGRTLIAHAAEEVRRFLVRDCSAAFARTRFLDLDDLLALTHPDAREQDGRALMALVLGGSLRPRALGSSTEHALMQRARGTLQPGTRRASDIHNDFRAINARAELCEALAKV